jgi:hypothetical protein
VCVWLDGYIIIRCIGHHNVEELEPHEKRYIMIKKIFIHGMELYVLKYDKKIFICEMDHFSIKGASLLKSFKPASA